MRQQKETYNFANLRICYLSLAGSTDSVGNPLLADFILVGKKLEKLGFIYHRGGVILIEPSEEVGAQK